jgi:hypothetical protein
MRAEKKADVYSLGALGLWLLGADRIELKKRRVGGVMNVEARVQHIGGDRVTKAFLTLIEEMMAAKNVRIELPNVRDRLIDILNQI